MDQSHRDVDEPRPEGEFADEPELRRARGWQRVAWAAGGLVLIAAGAGAFGRGPLSSATAGADGAGPGEEGSLQVRYERVVRQQAPTEVRVTADRALLGDDGRLRLWVDRDYLSDMRLESVDPAPTGVTSDQERTVFEFAARPAAEAVVVEFRFDVSTVGRVSMAMGIEAGSGRGSGRGGADGGGPTVRAAQFALP